MVSQQNVAVSWTRGPATRVSENINHCRSFSSIWCCTYYSAPFCLPGQPTPTPTCLTAALRSKSSTTISWAERLTPMTRNDIWLWHFTSHLRCEDLAYIPSLSSPESRREAVILPGCPTPYTWKSIVTGYPSYHITISCSVSWKEFWGRFNVLQVQTVRERKGP